MSDQTDTAVLLERLNRLEEQQAQAQRAAENRTALPQPKPSRFSQEMTRHQDAARLARLAAAERLAERRTELQERYKSERAAVEAELRRRSDPIETEIQAEDERHQAEVAKLLARENERHRAEAARLAARLDKARGPLVARLETLRADLEQALEELVNPPEAADEIAAEFLEARREYIKMERDGTLSAVVSVRFERAYARALRLPKGRALLRRLAEEEFRAAKAAVDAADGKGPRVRRAALMRLERAQHDVDQLREPGIVAKVKQAVRA